MIFSMSTSYFHINSFHYFEDYLTTTLTLGARYCHIEKWHSREFDYGVRALNNKSWMKKVKTCWFGSAFFLAQDAC
jgi:hypothetical protein